MTVDRDAALRECIAKHGWQVTAVDDRVPFAYSIGLYKSFGHPEIITFGLRREQFHWIINACGNRVQAGEKIPLNEPVEGIANFPLVFKSVARSYYRRFVGIAYDYYGGDDFPLIQLVWADREGRFPWDEGVTEEVRAAQPCLEGAAA